MVKRFLKNVLMLLVGIAILFILFTVMSINDTCIGIFDQDRYNFDKSDFKILHGGIEEEK